MPETERRKKKLKLSVPFLSLSFICTPCSALPKLNTFTFLSSFYLSSFSLLFSLSLFSLSLFSFSSRHYPSNFSRHSFPFELVPLILPMSKRVLRPWQRTVHRIFFVVAAVLCIILPVLYGKHRLISSRTIGRIFGGFFGLWILFTVRMTTLSSLSPFFR